ncbi:D-isomer specific 2-hydroxyacid dehydrogenase NAD-binding protein [Coriobacterium glomerans PW2]|uniref:D-isomer specific 2-hydroxyacid dehydrogenase NAD-binding protein n=1 Tax=Coriobacterium glomerans (strain ATCC 49209 / DSM 20642 / JCM 10262 / PW2) TaxID=700015 RepID=F2NAW9_CORGP|nr:phosphoglycerate dehydrogenase [Coriobacterium glomerans]AEB07647.1 D-isomer specific 2-hydroxyacid dehydrogenase NAD-binding protein [Coriobacterium glomerans PW2]
MNVLITPRGFARYGTDEIARMESLGLSVQCNTTGNPYSADNFLEMAKDSDAIIIGVDICDRAVMKQCQKLKVICKFGVGTDNIDLAYAKQRGIYVGRTVGSNSLSVAEHVAALMFADAKNLYPTIRDVKAGGWCKPTGAELHGKSLGIIGFGAIGKSLAKIATGIGMHVIIYDAFTIDPKTAQENECTIASLDELLEMSDYVSLHVPLLDSTRDMISTQQFDHMKRDACLLNASRGGIVDETALYEALKRGAIRSACFDVYSSEPPRPESPLLALDNFLLTSHIASRTREAERRTCLISTNYILEHLGLQQ